MKSCDFRYQWRNFKISSGDAAAYRRLLTSVSGNASVLWVGNQSVAGVDVLPPSKLDGLLGQSVEHLVFDARDDFDADAFAIAAGLVVGGGDFLLLTPPLDSWGKGGECVSRPFLRRLARLCGEYGRLPALPVPSAEGREGPTEDQLEVIEALQRVALGHSKRPLVVLADRGRGKSSAFGMAAAKLLTETGTRTILVTAPRMSATRMLFDHAALELSVSDYSDGLLESVAGRVQFVAPDELIRNAPPADLLLVDEAAGIPLPLLEALLMRYRRIAFSSTVHGYEGSGRGFILRFTRLLDRVRPQWKRLIMKEPVRWAPGDPLEAFSFRALLLDAEPVEIDEDLTSRLEQLQIRAPSRAELAADESLLRTIFGLLVSAHYRTTPKDLQHLLDAPNLTLWVGSIIGRPVAAMVVAREGPLPRYLHERIMMGEARPAENFLPLALASQCGFEEALNLSCERVMRIAVHPRLQRLGIGSRMLQTLRQTASSRDVDLQGSSFGATVELVDFWRRNGFVPLRLGFRREASSGAHSVLVLNDLAGDLQRRARRAFVDQFPLQLGEVFRNLEPSLAVTLGRCSEMQGHRLSSDDHMALQAFASGGRQYLDCLLPLYRLALLKLETGAGDADLFIVKLLQRRSWSETAEAFGLPGKKQVAEQLRHGVADYLASLDFSQRPHGDIGL